MSIDLASLGPSMLNALQGALPAAASSTLETPVVADSTAAEGGVPIADLATGTEPLPVDFDVALLASDVGNPESAGPDALNGWSRCTELPAGVELPAGGWIDPGTGIIYGPDGLQCAIYQRGGDYAVIFAGTAVTGEGDQPATMYMVDTTTGGLIPVPIPGSVVGVYNDWETNILQGVGFCSAQHKFAIGLAGEMVDTYPGRVIFGGHSLGGGHASAASLATGAPAVTFNAAGLSDGVISYATGQRNERDGTTRTSGEYLAEAESGRIRAYHTDIDILTGLQEGDSPQLPGDLPEAVGYPIEITDPGWSPMPELTGNPAADLLNGMANLLLTGHMMDTAEGGMFIGTRPVVGIAGLSVTVLEPPDSANILSVEGTGQTTITFADTPQGREAMRVFLITGQLPPDMAGVTRVETTYALGDERSMTTTTHYGESGLPIASQTSVMNGGLEVVRISRIYDAAGSEIVDQRTYTYTLTPADEAEAGMLNVVFGHDPHEGPFQPGQTTTITLTEAEIAELEADALLLPGNPDVNILADGDGDAGAFDGTTYFALDLAGISTPLSTFAKLLYSLRMNTGKIDEPVDAEIVSQP